MKIFPYLFVLTIIIGIVLATCKHEKEIDPNGPECGEATTIDEMMEWVYFKTGSYWIYEEQNTGALDTMTVYYDYNGLSATDHREFVCKIQSSLDGYTYEYWFNDAWSTESSLRPGCTIRAIDCDKYIPGDFAGGNHVFPFPLFISNRVYQWHSLENGPSQIINFAANDTIHSISYFNIYTIHQTYSPQHAYESSEYSIARNIGIVKKTISSANQTWELIENYIIQ